MTTKEGILERNEPGVGWARRMFRLSASTLTTYDESGDKELESFPLGKELFPQVFSRPEKVGKKFIFGIITKKDGKTKVLEANAENEESRTDWINSIKAVFKDPSSPRFSATGSASPDLKKPVEGMPEKKESGEKDCQCTIV